MFCVLLLTTLLGATLGHEVLSLPGPEGIKDYLEFPEPFDADLDALTMCTWIQNGYGDSDRYFLSYAVSGQYNELIFGEEDGFYGIWRGSEKWITTIATKEENVWSHVCWTWDGATGLAVLQLDGEVVAQKEGIKAGTAVQSGGLMLFGQEQDSFGGKFVARQAWLGRLYDFNMWDRVLTETELSSVYSSGYCGSGASSLEPTLAWSDVLDNELHGQARLVRSCVCDHDDAALGDGGFNNILSLPGPEGIEDYLEFPEPFCDNLDALTMCTWIQNAYGDSDRYFLSYAVSGSHNELIFGEEDGFYGIWRGSEKWITTIATKENVWSHVCWTWDGATGLAVLQLDGEVVTEKEGIKAGTAVQSGGLMLFGQEQDSVGGSFVARQAWLGRLYDFNMWDRVLNETELSFVYRTGYCGSGASSLEPILTWSDVLDNELHGAASLLQGSCNGNTTAVSHGKILRFPPFSDVTTGSFLQFIPQLPDTFTEFSVCTWLFKTYSDTARFFFSYANAVGEGGANSILIGEEGGFVSLHVDGTKMLTETALEQTHWYHLCVSWSSDGGAQIYLDADLIGEDADLAAGKTKNGGGTLNLGQEQDEVAGDYDVTQAFAGSLYNLNIYSEALSADQVSGLYANSTFCRKGTELAPPTYLSWNELYDVIPDGNVVFEDGEAAWKNGAPNCGTEEKDTEAHNSECWVEEAGVSFKDKSKFGYISGDVEMAKAACFATKQCVGLTCENVDNPDKLKCWLKVKVSKPKNDKKKVSFWYNC